MTASLPLVLRIGDDKTLDFRFRLKSGDYLDISDRTYTAQIRRTYSDPNVLAEFTCVVENGPEGHLVCTLSNAVTSTLRPGSAKWDLQEEFGDAKNTVFKGTVAIEQEITRP
jgi:hypothetical protein